LLDPEQLSLLGLALLVVLGLDAPGEKHTGSPSNCCFRWLSWIGPMAWSAATSWSPCGHCTPPRCPSPGTRLWFIGPAHQWKICAGFWIRRADQRLRFTWESMTTQS